MQPVSDPSMMSRRFTVTPLMEAGVLALAAAIAVTSYFVIAGEVRAERLMSQGLVALLLVGNLVPGVALIILLGRRIARRRAARSPVGGEGQLHVRLVALFSVMAAVPMLLVALVASVLFQYGIEFSSSSRARAMVANARELVRGNFQRELHSVVAETNAMSGDIGGYLKESPIESQRFQKGLVFQTLRRELSEAMILAANDPDKPLAVLNPSDRPMTNVVTARMLGQFRHGSRVVIVQSRDRIGAIVPLAYDGGSYLYASRVFDEQLAALLRRGDAILADYRALQSRSRTLQLEFNAALLALSLVIIGIGVWIALAVADRLVRPIGELVDAARRVEGGDLTARVTAPRTRDEVGTLASAFNQMTGRLQKQNTALVTANEQLDSRRALTEAVMGGVSAGVISVADDRTIRIINRSASQLLDVDKVGGDVAAVGRPLVEVSRELDRLLNGAAREAVVQVQAGTELRTLAVRIVRADAGPILTFDDVTQQLQDQRRAAWADVARRIAHEIKNPLTPIQLAAERLQRRYGRTVEEGDTTFGRLTETIVRQVGDLRRMVDEFSSFARMPKPVFRPEPLVDIARQTMFLHEVAHPGVRFRLIHDDPGPVMVCDRRQIGQALTNLVKNAVEAVEAAEADAGTVTMTLEDMAGRTRIEVADSGVGLPAERDRILEPYMTTRARGTGLGLAIVKKIVEEHGGTIGFTDRPGGGTIVTLDFDAAMLAGLETPLDTDAGEAHDSLYDGAALAPLTRTRI
ncbi:sensor histidine kinase NtrY-like [Sphingomonas bacterium]|uniref:sensor histidine kinase NtrY-like n=1 Tax=Sphingomonas bacterium TaxID=1895847 RepID=UPI0020C5FC2C|nr:ATP-binding protein [Sphingomonas bacterium]